MSRKKFIVWDWNGTLFDDFEAMLACNNIVFTRFGRAAATADTYRQNYEVPFSALLRNHGFSAEDVVVMDEQSKHIFHDHYEPHIAATGLRAGAKEILRSAAENGVRLLIVSNHLVGAIRAQLRRLDIEHMFEDVLAYADRGSQFRDMTKGDKLRAYLQERDIGSPEGLIVGDSTEEIEIAREQGFASVAITGGCVSEQRLAAAKPDYLIHSLTELAPIMHERGLVS